MEISFILICIIKGLNFMKLSLYGRCILPTQWGEFDTLVFRTPTGEEHMAICKGELHNQTNVLARIH